MVAVGKIWAHAGPTPAELQHLPCMAKACSADAGPYSTSSDNRRSVRLLEDKLGAHATFFRRIDAAAVLKEHIRPSIKYTGSTLRFLWLIIDVVTFTV